MKWRSLEPGDVVCTCRNEHRPIVRLEDVTELKNDALYFLVYFSDALASLLGEYVPTIVVERLAYFADGTTCRASECLTDPALCEHPELTG